MGFFTNKSVNLLNFHNAFLRSADFISYIFGPLFFYKHGVPIWGIALLWVLYFLTRLGSRFFCIHIVDTLGLQKTLIFTTAAMSCMWILLMQVEGVDGWIFAYMLLLGVIEGVHWSVSHTFYALCGDNDARGKQVAVGQFFETLSGILIPFVAGLVVKYLGFSWVFVAACVLNALAILPLLKIQTPQMQKLIPFSDAIKMPKWNLFLSVGNGVNAYGHAFLWVFVVYFLVGDIALFGGLIALGALVQAFLQLFFGHMVDEGHGRKMNTIGSGVNILQIVVQTFWVHSPLGVVLSESMGAGRKLLHDPAYFNAFFNYAKTSKHTFWSIVWAEVGFDIGAIFALTAIALLHVFDIPIQLGMLLGALGVLGSGILVHRYNLKHETKGVHLKKKVVFQN